MNIVVTGGGGFLGVNLVRRLYGLRHRIAIIDPMPASSVQSRLGMDRDQMAGRIHIHQGTTREILKDGLDRGPVDRVYHLGADASPPAYKAAPFQSLLAGSVGTQAACALAKNSGARLLLASTSEVYGDPAITPQPESYRGNVDPVGPRSMYDEAKRFSEAWVAAEIRNGEDFRIARIFNTFGPCMALDDGRMVTEFIRACIEGRPIEVHGTGTQTRTLCYVDDMVAGLIALMESDDVNPGCLGDAPNIDEPTPVNLGGDEEVMVGTVADEVRAAWHRVTGNVAPEINLVPQPCSQDPARRCPDTTRARELLGWQKTISWKRGIELTIRHALGESLPPR